jgi:hypothetical protein
MREVPTKILKYKIPVKNFLRNKIHINKRLFCTIRPFNNHIHLKQIIILKFLWNVYFFCTFTEVIVIFKIWLVFSEQSLQSSADHQYVVKVEKRREDLNEKM